MAQKDIDGLIKGFEDTHSEWLSRMDDSYDRIYSLLPYQLDDSTTADGTNVTSPEPRRFADKIMQTCEAAKIFITVTTPMDNSGKKKKIEETMDEVPTKSAEKETAIERLAYGLINIANQRLRRNKVIAGRTIQAADIFYGAIRGSICHRTILVKDGDKVYPDILPVDPRYFAFGLDDEGLAWGAIRTWRDPDAIKNEYNVDVDEITPIIDFWDAKENIIQIGKDASADQIIQKHNLGAPPFSFVPVGAAPLIYSLDSKFTNVVNLGQDIFAASRDLYSVKNAVLTVWLSLLMKSHKPSYFGFMPGAKMKLEKLPYGTNEILWLPNDPGTRMEPVRPPDIAMSAPQLFNIIDREIQANDLATIEYGMIAGTEYPSGKSMLALQEGKDSKITPILNALSSIFEDTIEMLVNQYAEVGAKLTVKGYDSKGKLFYQEVKPTDVKKPWDIEVKFISITPEQETQNIAKAQMLTNMGVAEDYIYENALQMQDPDKPKRQKLLQELENTNPVIKTLHQLEAAKKEGHTKEAQVLAFQLKAMIEKFSASLQPAPEQPAPQEQLPPDQAQPSPEQMPPAAPSGPPMPGGMPIQ
jgi:hypothetical protein